MMILSIFKEIGSPNNARMSSDFHGQMPKFTHRQELNNLISQGDMWLKHLEGLSRAEAFRDSPLLLLNLIRLIKV